MSETLIEKAAKASHAACLKHYDGTFKHGNDPLETHRVCVVAILKAIREPMNSMLMPGNDAIDDWDESDPKGVVMDGRSFVCWRAMIDAALSEASETRTK